MTAQNWGNNDPSRQHQVPSQQLSQPFSYSKLYLTIVAAILTAFLIMGVVSMLFSAAVLKSLTTDFNSKTSALSQPKSQHSPVLQQSVSKSTRQTTAPYLQSAASKADMQTCTFWRQQYQKERSDRNKMHVNSSCGRAYGNLWNEVK